MSEGSEDPPSGTGTGPAPASPAPEPPPRVVPVVEPSGEPVIAEGPVPVAPVSATVADLQEAVGVTPSAPAPRAAPPPVVRRPVRRPITEDELEEPTARRRWPIALLLVFFLGAVVTVFVLLGRANRDRYSLVCSAKHIRAERGRSWPPWGTESIGGAPWAPIAILPNAECTPRETDDLVELEGWYLEALLEQATTKLSGDTAGDVDQAEQQLQQALLLTRSPERRDQRKEIERLIGDVTYWRGSAKVKAAAAALVEAAQRFDEAAARRPRHASDAGAWAEFARGTAGALGAGPGGVGAPQLPPSGVPLPSRPLAPPGVALPVEGGAGPDAGVVEAPADAGGSNLPAGGVLL